MSTKSDIPVKKLAVTEQHFLAHKPQPKKGNGFANYGYSDNSKECLGSLSDIVRWDATLTMKAYDSIGEKPDPEKDVLLMEALIRVSVEIATEGKFETVEELQNQAWSFKMLCQHQLLGQLKLLLLGTEYAHIPLPGSL